MIKKILNWLSPKKNVLESLEKENVDNLDDVEIVERIVEGIEDKKNEDEEILVPVFGEKASKILQFLISPDESNRKLGKQLLISQEYELSGREFNELKNLSKKIETSFDRAFNKNVFRLNEISLSSFKGQYSMTEYINNVCPTVEEININDSGVDVQSIKKLVCPETPYKNLKNLKICNNKIKFHSLEIDFLKMPVLESLSIWGNLISELRLTNPNNVLKTLFVYRNCLDKKSLDEIGKLVSLESLTIDYSALKFLDYVLIKTNWQTMRSLHFSRSLSEKDEDIEKEKNKLQKILPNTYLEIYD